jgi:hypothetical protein
MGLFSEAKLRPGYVQLEGGLPFKPDEPSFAGDLREAYERGLNAKWSGSGHDVDQFEDDDLRQAFLQGFNS